MFLNLVYLQTFKLVSIKNAVSFTFLRYSVNLKFDYKGVLSTFPFLLVCS